MSNKCLWASYGKMSEQIWKASLGKYVKYSRLHLGKWLNSSLKSISDQSLKSSYRPVSDKSLKVLQDHHTVNICISCFIFKKTWQTGHVTVPYF
jgi:hypothetical protein